MKSFECNDCYWFRRSYCCTEVEIWWVRKDFVVLLWTCGSIWWELFFIVWFFLWGPCDYILIRASTIRFSLFFISITVIQLTKRLCPFKDRPIQEENQQGTKLGQRTSKAYKCHMISPLKHFAPLLHKATNLKETYYMGYDIFFFFFFSLFRWGSAHNSFWRNHHIIDNSSFFSLLHFITFLFHFEKLSKIAVVSIWCRLKHRGNNVMNGDHGFWLWCRFNKDNIDVN